jgi:hypothetical protein
MNNQGIDHEDMLSVIERAYARAYETLSELHVCKVQIRSPMTAQASAKDLAVRSKVKASFESDQRPCSAGDRLEKESRI